MRRRRIVAGISLIFIVPWVFSPMIEDICKDHESTDITGCIVTLAEYRAASALSNEAGSYYGKNYRKSMELHKKAAATGWANSSYDEFYIAKMYDEGYGVTKNLPLAIKWYTKSAERGSNASQTNLGVIYRLEKSIQNYTLSHMWLSIAIKNGGRSAARAKRKTEKLMTKTELEESARLTKEWLAAHP
jgi:hypothetical protein